MDDSHYKNGHQDASIENIWKAVKRIEKQLDVGVVEHHCDRRHKVLWVVISGLAAFDAILLGMVIKNIISISSGGA